jgi:predicted protein tyrosine phosphatase
MPLREIFKVSCLPKAADVAVQWRATHVVSLVDPELPDVHLPVIRSAEHIIARLRDQETPAFTESFPSIVKNLFETVRPAIERSDIRVLVHCHAGVSRSTAFAYALAAYKMGKGRERDAFSAFMALVNKPWPNRRIVEILDQYLERDGAMLAELDQMRSRYPRRIDAWHRFNSRRGLPEVWGTYQR